MLFRILNTVAWALRVAGISQSEWGDYAAKNPIAAAHDLRLAAAMLTARANARARRGRGERRWVVRIDRARAEQLNAYADNLEHRAMATYDERPIRAELDN